VSELPNVSVDISILELFRIAKEMALGVDHLHRNNIIHRDLALRNFVLDDNNRVVLIDLGLARIVSKVQSSFFGSSCLCCVRNQRRRLARNHDH